jgi:hypothetical protein
MMAISTEQSEAISDTVAAVFAKIEREVLAYVCARVINEGKQIPSVALANSQAVFIAAQAIIAAWRPVVAWAVEYEASILKVGAAGDIADAQTNELTAKIVADAAAKDAQEATTKMMRRLDLISLGMAKGAQDAYIKAATA